MISTSPDYKGKNKKIEQERFSLLYVWAYNLAQAEPVPNKEHLTQGAKLNGIYDKNYSTYLNSFASKFFIRADGTFKLNPGGHLQVTQIIADMHDPRIEGFNYWSSTPKVNNRGPRVNKEDAQNLEQWLKSPSKFDDFDVRKLSKAADWGLLVLYHLIKELKVREAVKPGVAYDYARKRYKTVPIHRDIFSAALRSKDNSKYFSRTSDGLYYLTPKGEEVVKGWII